MEEDLTTEAEEYIGKYIPYYWQNKRFKEGLADGSITVCKVKINEKICIDELFDSCFKITKL